MLTTTQKEIVDAIDRKLHLGTRDNNWQYPVEITPEGVVMRQSDCGTVRPTVVITIECWRERIKLYGLYKKVGMWSFVKADDPAAGDIAFCERSPHSGGRRIHRLEAEVAKLKEELIRKDSEC
jgi:hypothetical protein